MKITKARLKEIIKEEVVKIFEEKKPRWIYVDDEESGKSLGIWASSVPEAEEKSEKVDYSKYKDGDDVMSTKKVEEDLDEMSAMSTGAVATSPKKETLEEEDGFYEPHIWPDELKWPGGSEVVKKQKARKKANQEKPK